jgi:hypothetical protein
VFRYAVVFLNKVVVFKLCFSYAVVFFLVRQSFCSRSIDFAKSIRVSGRLGWWLGLGGLGW